MRLEPLPQSPMFLVQKSKRFQELAKQIGSTFANFDGYISKDVEELILDAGSSLYNKLGYPTQQIINAALHFEEVAKWIDIAWQPDRSYRAIITELNRPIVDYLKWIDHLPGKNVQQRLTLAPKIIATFLKLWAKKVDYNVTWKNSPDSDVVYEYSKEQRLAIGQFKLACNLAIEAWHLINLILKKYVAYCNHYGIRLNQHTYKIEDINYDEEPIPVHPKIMHLYRADVIATRLLNLDKFISFFSKRKSDIGSGTKGRISVTYDKKIAFTFAKYWKVAWQIVHGQVRLHHIMEWCKLENIVLNEQFKPTIKDTLRAFRAYVAYSKYWADPMVWGMDKLQAILKHIKYSDIGVLQLTVDMNKANIQKGKRTYLPAESEFRIKPESVLKVELLHQATLTAYSATNERLFTYYHGTDDEAKAKSIMKQGIKPPNIEHIKSKFFTPVVNKVYITRSLEYAIMYVIGGDIAGTDYQYKGSRYGYLFIIPGYSIQDVQPDEDDIGRLIYEAKFKWLNNLAERILAKSTLRRVMDGEYLWWAKAGKMLLKHITVEQQKQITEVVPNLAHDGTLYPTSAWKFDKKNIFRLEKDGSNFFQLAKEVL